MLEKFNIYNKDIKEAYLNYYSRNENSQQSVIYALQRGEPLETQLNKDMSQFDMFEVDQMAKSMDTTSEQMLRTILSMFSAYTEWCMENVKELNINLNFYRLFLNQKKDLKEYVSMVETKNMYISDEDIEIIVDRLINPQDKAYVLGLYEGIRGSALSEIRNLKISDIDDNANIVKLYDDNGKTRNITISDKLKEILYEADKQVVYLANNGVMSPGLLTNKRTFRVSPYIIKPKSHDRKGSPSDERLSPQNTSRLIEQIRSYLKDMLKEDDSYMFVTPRSIYDSGIVNKVIKAYNEGEISSLQIPEIEKVIKDYKLSYGQLYNMKKKIEFCLDMKYLV